MPRLVDILGIGKSGLFASQIGISTSGHNIANINTKNYTRQRVSYEANPPEILRDGQLGQGVALESISRALDIFLEKQIISQRSTLGEFSSQQNALKQVEMVFNESSGISIASEMDKFFNSWRDLSNQPADINQRLEVLNQAENLTTTFHKQYRQIFDTQLNLNVEIEDKVSELNRLSQEISELNKKITGTEFLPSNANDLRDRLDANVKRVAEIVQVNVFLDEKGFTNIQLANGAPLVTGADFNTLTVSPSPTSGFNQIYHQRPNGVQTDVTDDLVSGELAGLIYVRDQTLEGYKSTLDQLAFEFATQVNTIHQNGYNLDNATNINFFNNLVGVTGAARDIDLSIDVLDQPEAISASLEMNLLGNTVTGNNENALALADLQNNLTLGNSTFNEFYRNLLYQVGSDVRDNEEYIALESSKKEQLDSFRESISGVSIDEEMTNIIQFQRNFEAASKVIKTVDQMLQVVLSLKD